MIECINKSINLAKLKIVSSYLNKDFIFWLHNHIEIIKINLNAIIIE